MMLVRDKNNQEVYPKHKKVLWNDRRTRGQLTFFYIWKLEKNKK
jgi:hypothetical protein